MPRFGPDSSECRVYTRRTGMLSAVGHDLAIAVTAYEIDVDDAASAVRARFDARSLRVVGAIVRDALQPDALSPRDRAQIEHHIRADVLDADRHPHVEFESTEVVAEGDGYRVAGRLRLHGVERNLALHVRRSGEQLQTEVELHQPDFGIKPFRALGGTLRVHPDVRVAIRLDVAHAR